MPVLPTWSEYQERTAEFFRALDMTATTNVTVQGVRGSHAVDVLVAFTRFGIAQTWVVECKHWSTAVSKDKVLTLLAVVQDVGADKGFLVADSGFQSGALRAASNTNLVLTSLETLKVDSETELTLLTISRASSRVEDIMTRLREMCWRQEYRTTDRSGGLWGYAPPNYFELIGRLSVIERSLKSAARGDFPVALDLDDPERRSTSDIAELMLYSEQLFARSEAYMVDYGAWTPSQGPNKTDAGNGSEAICRVSNVLRSPSPDSGRSAKEQRHSPT